MYFSHSDILHGSDKRRMNNASGLSPFFLVDGCKAFSAWMASIAPREESTPSPRQAPHLITTGQEDDRSPARSPSHVPHQCYKTWDWMRERLFDLSSLSVQCRTRRCHSSASKRPLGPSLLLPLCARPQVDGRGGGEEEANEQ